MTAITVTPEMVRVVFLRRTGRSLNLSLGVKAFIISALESMRVSWCLAAIWVLRRLTSSWVGFGRVSRVFMMSRAALSVFKVWIPY
jgi:hypothetical protein